MIMIYVFKGELVAIFIVYYFLGKIAFRGEVL